MKKLITLFFVGLIAMSCAHHGKCGGCCSDKKQCQEKEGKQCPMEGKSPETEAHK